MPVSLSYDLPWRLTKRADRLTEKLQGYGIRRRLRAS